MLVSTSKQTITDAEDTMKIEGCI